MDQQIYAVTGTTNNTRVLRGYRVTNGRQIIVHSRTIIVDLITCFDYSSWICGLKLLLNYYTHSFAIIPQVQIIGGGGVSTPLCPS